MVVEKAAISVIRIIQSRLVDMVITALQMGLLRVGYREDIRKL